MTKALNNLIKGVAFCATLLSINVLLSCNGNNKEATSLKIVDSTTIDATNITRLLNFNILSSISFQDSLFVIVDKETSELFYFNENLELQQRLSLEPNSLSRTQGFANTPQGIIQNVSNTSNMMVLREVSIKCFRYHLLFRW